MLFSIRDNKYKIDLIPISAWNDLIGEAVLFDFPYWMSPNTISKEEFIKISYHMVIMKISSILVNMKGNS